MLFSLFEPNCLDWYNLISTRWWSGDKGTTPESLNQTDRFQISHLSFSIQWANSSMICGYINKTSFSQNSFEKLQNSHITTNASILGIQYGTSSQNLSLSNGSNPFNEKAFCHSYSSIWTISKKCKFGLESCSLPPNFQSFRKSKTNRIDSYILYISIMY